MIFYTEPHPTDIYDKIKKEKLKALYNPNVCFSSMHLTREAAPLNPYSCPRGPKQSYFNFQKLVLHATDIYSSQSLTRVNFVR